MIYKVPRRFTTLHFAQRFLIEDETFMLVLLFNDAGFSPAKVLIISLKDLLVQHLPGFKMVTQPVPSLIPVSAF